MPDHEVSELEAAVNREDWGEAIRVARPLKGQGVEHWLIDVSFANEFLRNLQFREAFFAAEEAQRKDPSNRFAARIRASAAQEMGQTILAKYLIESKAMPSADARLIKSRSAFEKGDYATTRAEAVRYLKDVPSSPEAVALIHAARWLGDRDAGSRVELERLFYEEDSIEAGFKLFFCLHTIGDLPLAMNVMERCARLDPSNPWPQIRLIGTYEETGKYKEGFKAFDEMPVQFRDLPFAQLLYARLLAQDGKLKEAEQICWKLFRAAPEDFQFFRTLTWVLRKRRKWFMVCYTILLGLLLTRKTIGKATTEARKKS